MYLFMYMYFIDSCPQIRSQRDNTFSSDFLRISLSCSWPKTHSNRKCATTAKQTLVTKLPANSEMNNIYMA